MVLCYSLFPLTCTLAQKQANVWYFSERAGIDFNNGKTVPLLDGKANSFEMNACISDKNGKLQFYTDEETIYNRDHQVMVNGSGLRVYSINFGVQTVIVPQPESETIYYLFHIGSELFEPGKVIYKSLLFYSVIDMSLDNGRGVVIEKNTLLFDNTAPRLSAVHHANGTDVWLVTHEGRNNVFGSYLITAAGIDANPVRSGAGNEHGGFLDASTSEHYDFFGQMKLSPTGKKIGVAHATQYKNELPSVRLFDFDDRTGAVTNEKIVFKSNPNSVIFPLGLEFSSNGQLLYFTETHLPTFLSIILNDTNIHQIDLNSLGNPTARTIFNGKNTTYGVLQLGPDGRIYCPVNRARSTSDPEYVSHGYLDVIECPNNLGAEASLRTNSFQLYNFNTQPPYPRSIYRSIPQFIQSYFKEQQPIIKMPNVFTPNNDEFNPVFKPIDISLVRSARLKIFNRWGAVVYETNDPFLGWDGGEFETGVYYWLIDAVGTSCQPATRKGWLQLIR